MAWTPGRIYGLFRSFTGYHAIPLRQRRLRRLYAAFAGPGDLVFDVGAHAGNRTRALAALGCRVVALEPQPDFARLLRLLFGRHPRVSILQAAAGDRSGVATLSVSDRTPTMTTLATAWRTAREHDPVFAGVQWNRSIDVEVLTLDALITRFGRPAFVKIDVEGAEPAVLAGLTRPVPALSFEYLPGTLDYARACVDRLLALGTYRFNWSVGESYQLAAGDWVDGDALLDALKTGPARHRSGDVYARCRSGDLPARPDRQRRDVGPRRRGELVGEGRARS